MRAIIRDFRGLENLDAEIEGVLLLAGANGAGKTSGCQAIAAAASGVVLPFDGVAKQNAALLVRDGAREAVVELGTAEAAVRVTWPRAERETRGRFLDASKIACGLENPALMSPKDRAGWATSFLAAFPDEATITEHLTKAGIPAERAALVLRAITAGGWDRAHATAKEDGARLKGAWEKTTGERFGSTKAASWRPAGYTEADDRDPEALVETRVTTWQKSLDSALARQAVNAAELAKLRGLSDQVRPLEYERDKAEAEANQAQMAVQKATEARLACPSLADAGTRVDCPYCGGPLAIIGNTVHAATAETGGALKQIEEIEVRTAKALEAVRDAHRNAREAERKHLELIARVKTAREAADKLLVLPIGKAAGEDRVSEARAGLAAAEAKRDAWRKAREARELAAQIEQQITIVHALAEDGIRKSVLADRLGEFNNQLVDVCEQASWRPVHIDLDMSLSYGGRPYSLCSAGEQFRVSATLQLAIARREEAPLVIIDGADVLDRAGRNGLFAVLAAFGAPSVVGMTLMREVEMPDLAAAGIGKSVWIEHGTEVHPSERAAA